jgi:hypothetical protein
MEDEKDKLIQNIENSYVEPQGDSDEDIEKRVALWSGRLSDAESVQKSYQSKWGDWYEMMYAATQTDKMALWKSKAFLPILAGKVWDLVSRFVQYKPSWAVELYNLPVSMDSESLQAYLTQVYQNYDKVKMKMDYDYNDPVRRVPIQDEFFSVLMDSIVTGTGVARVTYEEATIEQREHPLDAMNNVDITVENVTTLQRGFNNFESVNIFNFYIDPSATDLQTANWIIVQDVATKAELLTHPEYDQAAIEKVKFGVINDDTAVYQKSKMRNLNTQDPASADNQEQKTHILDCWDGEANTHTVYAVSEDKKRFVELFHEDNPYWHQKYPYVPFRIRRKPHLFWGESFFENSESLQSAMNDLFNHYMDNLNLTDGMIAIEEGSVVEPYMIEPGGEFRYRGERPTQFKFPEPNPAQLTTVMNEIQGVIENITISQYASGVPNSATDTTQGTATGVTRLMEAATEKIGMMRQNIRRSWAEVGNMWLVNSQQFMVDPVVYQKNTYKGSVTEMITPTDIRGNFVLRIDENSFEPISEDQMRSNYIEYIANLQNWANASREQAKANGNTEGIISIDYAHAAERLSELSSENPSTILMRVEQPQALNPEEQEEPAEEPALNAIGEIEPPQGMNAGTETPEMYMSGEEATADAKSLGLDRGLKENTTRSIKGIVL